MPSPKQMPAPAVGDSNAPNKPGATQLFAVGASGIGRLASFRRSPSFPASPVAIAIRSVRVGFVQERRKRLGKRRRKGRDPSFLDTTPCRAAAVTVWPSTLPEYPASNCLNSTGAQHDTVTEQRTLQPTMQGEGRRDQ